MSRFAPDHCTKLNNKGQITIPASVRSKLGFKAGDRLYLDTIKGTAVIKKVSAELENKINKSFSEAFTY